MGETNIGHQHDHFRCLPGAPHQPETEKTWTQDGVGALVFWGNQGEDPLVLGLRILKGTASAVWFTGKTASVGVTYF